MQKAVFLDRDGVINSNEGLYYIYRIEDFRLNEGVVKGLKLLSDNGYLLFIVSNQGGVAKGLLTTQEVDNIHHHLKKILAKYDIYLTEIYYCPHHESVNACECRKPQPYFINKAIEKYKIDPKNTYFIGDSLRDMEAAYWAGIKGLKVESNENILSYCETIVANQYL